MIAIIDYGIGNIHSLISAFQSYELNGLPVEVVLTSDERLLNSAQMVILPGVGAFRYAMEELEKRNLVSVIKELYQSGKPIVGICLGMQLLYESSEEYGLCKGLGLLKGKIIELPSAVKKPHMGWNTLSTRVSKSNLLSSLSDESYVYFVHSFYADGIDESTLIACTNYGVKVPAIVKKENLIGFQFHPEKSGMVGSQLIQNLLNELINQ